MKIMDWRTMNSQTFMQTPLRELKLPFRGSWVHSLFRLVAEELKDSDLPVPSVWISDDWFCPDGVFGFAVPFYLFHPKLIRLQEAKVGEAEGSNEPWCLKLLRHEIGHAIDNAFNLREMAGRKEIFGDSRRRYPKAYNPNPQSKDYVLHLEGYYAQSHPDEDWAETFAVWLDPHSNWEHKYKRWPKAMEKLLFMDYAMEQIAGQKPSLRTRQPVEPLSYLDKTLGQHYRALARQKQKYSADSSYIVM
jgi:hypothetical protein